MYNNVHRSNFNDDYYLRWTKRIPSSLSTLPDMDTSTPVTFSQMGSVIMSYFFVFGIVAALLLGEKLTNKYYE